MTAATVFPTSLPHAAGSHLGHSANGSPAAGHADARVAACAPLTALEVCDLLQQHRAALHAELEELKGDGVSVAVPPDAVFLCELAGLVLDLTTGQVTGLAEGHVAPLPSLRARLVEQGFVLGAVRSQTSLTGIDSARA